MEKVRLGRTNIMVSKVAFGSIPIQRVSEDYAVSVVRKCISLGINFIDTANAYTTSEERIGKAISGKRKELIIATKTLARTREEVEKHIAGLNRMDFFENKNGRLEEIQDLIIQLSASIDVIKETEPEFLLKYELIPWDKYIKIGKATDEGKWALVYSIAWRMVSKGLADVKGVVLELLELNKREIKEDFF